MKTLDEAVRHDLAAAPQPASLERLRRLTRRRRSRRMLSGALPLLVVVIVVGFLLNSTQHSRGVEVSPSSTPAQSAPTTTLDPRGATANVAYVKRLVTENRLPHASAVTRVRAEADEIVVSTSLTDTINAEELWEGLKLAIGCDDSFLGIKGYFVLLKDGSRRQAPPCRLQLRERRRGTSRNALSARPPARGRTAGRSGVSAMRLSDRADHDAAFGSR